MTNTSDVETIQVSLNEAAHEHLRVDGDDGPLTEAALRRFQAAHGLAPDGVAGTQTRAALREAVPAAGGSLALSGAGCRFLYAHEAQRGVSNRLYWPGGDSGVTLGAGYDMKERDAAGIAAELAGLGLPASVCAAAAHAAGLSGADAEDFASAYAGLVSLTEDQETSLLQQTVPPYETIVRDHIRIPLAQHEFDALVSFAYNPGGSIDPVARLINAGDAEAAMQRIRGRVFSGRMMLDGLVRRRTDETRLYLTGCYAA